MEVVGWNVGVLGVFSNVRVLGVHTGDIHPFVKDRVWEDIKGLLYT